MPRQSLVETKSFYVATGLAKVKGNYVTIECFCVATKFGQGQELLCCDRVFLCRDRFWPWMGFYVAIEYFHVTIGFGLDMRY